MNCDNTIADGFYFWIGKALAELSIGLGLLAIFVIIYAVFVLLYGRKK